MNFRNLAAAGKLARSSQLSRRNSLLNLYPVASTSLYSSAATSKPAAKKSKFQLQQPASPPKPVDFHPTPSPPKSVDCQSPQSPPQPEDWPRPTEIPWQIKVANSVNLIGYVKFPVQSSRDNGKFYARTQICRKVNDSVDSPPCFRIPVIFEGDLAHIAVCHLKKDDFVHISGQLSVDLPHSSLAEGLENIQVMVDSVSYVQGDPLLKKTAVAPKQEMQVKRPASIAKDAENSWRELLKNSEDWYDYRESKQNGLVNPKYPDFKQKKTGVPLWLGTAPLSVMQGLKLLKFDAPPMSTKQSLNDKKEPELDEDPWKNLVENPDKWWDNRSNKRNEKAPDFKNKESGTALWLNRAPTWALSKLPLSKV